MKPGRRAFVRNSLVTAAASMAMPALSGASERDRPRAAGFGRKQLATGRNGMAITSHPLATRAATDMLRSGGNACDAALSAAITQTVVEPHMTTITGVLSMLYYEAASGKVTYVNGSLNAPRVPLEGFRVADLSTGRGVGVPGFWAGFEASLERHGSRPKSEIVAPAIAYARDGIEIYPFLYGMMFEQVAKVGRTEAGRAMYFRDGALRSPGDTLRQPDAARTLERLVAEGNDFFYRGEFARRLCEVVADAGGVLTPEDFAAYDVRWMEPARGTYRGLDVLASPPPDNGGTHIIEALNMIELMDVKAQGPAFDSAETLYQMIRIHNEVFTAGGRQNDPASHPLPLELILSKEYARMRFELLQMGKPNGASDGASPYPGSNQVTVVDGRGNVATILHSCMSFPWSNGLFVDGISICAGGAHFLRVMPKPGFRISAYVAPNMLLRNGKPVLVSGSPSVGLLANILQNTINLMDLGMSIEDSVARPRFGGSAGLTGGPADANHVEVDLDEKVREAVVARGAGLDVVNPWNFHLGSFEGIAIDADSRVATACGDPRRCSVAESA